MSQDKKEMSDRERERRARQAEKAQNAHNNPQTPGQGFKGTSGGFNPSPLVQKHQKKTGRGP